MPIRLADVAVQPREQPRLFVNPPEEAQGRVESVHADEDGRFLGYVNEMQRVVRIVQDETPPALAYNTYDDAPLLDIPFRTEEAVQLRLTLPVYPATGMYFMPGGPMVIEGTATMATSTLYTMTNAGQADVIWTHWTTGTANTTAATSTVWQTWQNTTVTGSNVLFSPPRAAPAPLTPEQIAEQKARAERYARKARRDARRRELAEVRGQRLLHELLTDEQAAEYAERRSFHVRVRDRTFRVNHGKAGNVTEVDEAGRAIAKYCVHLYGAEPTEDSMVAQLLMLQTDIEEFERKANVTRYRQRVAA